MGISAEILMVNQMVLGATQWIKRRHGNIAKSIYAQVSSNFNVHNHRYLFWAVTVIEQKASISNMLHNNNFLNPNNKPEDLFVSYTMSENKRVTHYKAHLCSGQFQLIDKGTVVIQT